MSEIFAELQMAELERQQQQANGASPQAHPSALTVSADDFSALEERIVRAVEIVKRERQTRAAAEERAAQAEEHLAHAEQRAEHAEAQLDEQKPRIDQLEKDLSALQGEREQVRQRVERLLAQLDALEL